MEIIVRKANLNDLKEINEVHISTFKNTYIDIFSKTLLNSINKEKLLERKIKEINNIILAQVDGKIVGYLNYSFENRDNLENTGEINAWYILKEYQGKNIGKQMFNFVKKILRENILVYVQYNHYISIKIYEKLGFKKSNKIIEEGEIKAISMIYMR